jgi:hypothetical protein
MDGIFLALQEEEQRTAVPYLVKILHACLATGWVPATWHQVEIVFM